MFTDKVVACPCWQNLLGSRYCSTCLLHLKSSLLPRTLSFQLENKVTLRAMGRYDAAMKDFIYYSKSALFNGLMPAQKNLLKDLSAHWASELRPLQVDVVVPVPGHPLRSRMQTDLAWFLARYLSQDLGLGEPECWIKRKFFIQDKIYRSQKFSTRVERARDIRQQFYLQPNRKKNDFSKILLVDDVCTTGSTLKFCAELLEGEGYKGTTAITLARVESFSEAC